MKTQINMFGSLKRDRIDVREAASEKPHLLGSLASWSKD